MHRRQLTEIAEETVAVIANGGYDTRDGEHVSIDQQAAAALARVRCVTPAQWAELEAQVAAEPSHLPAAPITVTAETTLQAAARLARAHPGRILTALNFASARKPGGGWRSGAMAQEETLGRGSALVPTLEAAAPFYNFNRACSSLLYTDHAILSPGVPVFRIDDGPLLDRPFLTTFITMPAANAGAMRPDDPKREQVEATMARRTRQVLTLAAVAGGGHLILGAWGCGVFRNDPVMIARCFASHLDAASDLRRRFDSITFAVYDRSHDHATRAAFEQAFTA